MEGDLVTRRSLGLGHVVGAEGNIGEGIGAIAVVGGFGNLGTVSIQKLELGTRKGGAGILRILLGHRDLALLLGIQEGELMGGGNIGCPDVHVLDFGGRLITGGCLGFGQSVLTKGNVGEHCLAVRIREYRQVNRIVQGVLARQRELSACQHLIGGGILLDGRDGCRLLSVQSSDAHAIFDVSGRNSYLLVNEGNVVASGSLVLMNNVGAEGNVAKGRHALGVGGLRIHDLFTLQQLEYRAG